VEVVGVARSGRQALAAIRQLRPELVFLDIEMPGMSGFEVVQSLQADDSPADDRCVRNRLRQVCGAGL
jgi:two-component system LytT family response regulator